MLNVNEKPMSLPLVVLYRTVGEVCTISIVRDLIKSISDSNFYGTSLMLDYDRLIRKHGLNMEDLSMVSNVSNSLSTIFDDELSVTIPRIIAIDSSAITYGIS